MVAITDGISAFLYQIMLNTGGAGGGAAQDATIVISNAKLDQLHADMIAATPAGANIIGKVGIDQTTPGTTNGVVVNSAAAFNTALPTYTNGQLATLQTTNKGTLLATLTDGTGTQITNNATADALTVSIGVVVGRSHGLTFNGSSWDRTRKANVTARLLSSAATTNATSVKASAGDLYKITGFNTAAATKRYLKLYNKASAPTVGTDTPVMTISLAAASPFDFSFAGGHYFSTGIAYAITGAAADADTTAIVAGDIECLNLTYA
jgi:hypothetical protein